MDTLKDTAVVTPGRRVGDRFGGPTEFVGQATGWLIVAVGPEGREESLISSTVAAGELLDRLADKGFGLDPVSSRQGGELGL